MDTNSTDKYIRELASILDSPKEVSDDHEEYKQYTRMMWQLAMFTNAYNNARYVFLILKDDGVEITGLDKKTAAECFKRLTAESEIPVSLAPWDEPPEEEYFRILSHNRMCLAF